MAVESGYASAVVFPNKSATGTGIMLSLRHATLKETVPLRRSTSYTLLASGFGRAPPVETPLPQCRGTEGSRVAEEEALTLTIERSDRFLWITQQLPRSDNCTGRSNTCTKLLYRVMKRSPSPSHEATRIGLAIAIYEAPQSSIVSPSTPLPRNLKHRPQPLHHRLHILRHRTHPLKAALPTDRHERKILIDLPQQQGSLSLL